MVNYKDFVAGWIDSSIHALFHELPRTGKSLQYTLITCIDSNRDPHSLLTRSPELRSILKKAQQVGTGVLVPTQLLLEVDSKTQIFFGFDEVWFFPNKQITPKPASSSLVGPGRIDKTKLKKLGPWMSENSCSLGLGDGEGLNFVVRARGLVRYLLGHSIEQERPTAVLVGSSRKYGVE